MINIKISIISDFIKYFTTSEIKEKAKETGFIKRSDAKLLPVTFIKVFTLGLWSCQGNTLEHSAQMCQDMQAGLTITKQALHQKLNVGVKLLKEMFHEAMSYALRHNLKINVSPALNKFNNIYVCDSTSMALPDKLKSDYRGNGGTSKSKAVLKLQAVFNLKTRCLRDIEIKQGVESDQSHLDHILGILDKNDLVIHDLGFFSKEYLTKVCEKGAYFLSKIYRTTVFYPAVDSSRLEPLKLDEIFKKSKDFIDTKICIGKEKKKRMVVRLIAKRLPDQISNERIRRARIRVKGKVLSQHEKILLCWNIIITNADVEKLSSDLSFELYRNRWQIELVFKAWKSHMGLRNIAHGGKSQMECMLYGRLIIITLMSAMYSHLYFLVFQKWNRELSILKLFSILKCKSFKVLEYLNSDIKKAIVQIKSIFIETALKSQYEKRKRKTSLTPFLGNDFVFKLENCG